MSYLLNESEIEEIKKQAIAEYLLEHSGILKNRWIPCSERLPNKEEYLKNDGRFIVTDENRVYQSIYDIYINKGFMTLQVKCLIDLGYQSSFEVDKRVIAWQPLPEPYKKQKFSDELLEKVWNEILS